MKNDPSSHYDLYKLPRLYLNAAFVADGSLPLSPQQAHYLRNVLRKQESDYVRVFNGKDGEWRASLSQLGKKGGEITLEECIKAQPDKDGAGRDIHLYFSPIKKQRMDMLIEKAVELGVAGLHPVVMNRSVLRKINEERICTQIIEAAEQCERMDIPALHPVQSLEEVLGALGEETGGTPFYACVERVGEEGLSLAQCNLSKGASFLIGPEGGFDEDEIAALRKSEQVKPVTLGQAVLRAETAGIVCLSYALLAEEN